MCIVVAMIKMLCLDDEKAQGLGRLKQGWRDTLVHIV